MAIAGSLLARVLAGGGFTAPARPAGSLRFCLGLFALVLVTLAVIVGPVASNRIVLVAQRRMATHSPHHALGVAAVCCLGLRVATELAADPAGGSGPLLPITSAPLMIGLGAVAAHLILTVLRTGTVRARFARDLWVWLRREPPAPAHLAWRVALWQELNPRPPPAADDPALRDRAAARAPLHRLSSIFTFFCAAPGPAMRPALAVRER